MFITPINKGRTQQDLVRDTPQTYKDDVVDVLTETCNKLKKKNGMDETQPSTSKNAMIKPGTNHNFLCK